MRNRQKKKNNRDGKDSPDRSAGKKRLLQWHPAFFAGLQIELSEEAEYLSFESEHPLSSRPMQMDALIIKKDRERRIKKNIGRIFRTYNIVEYKSPDDSLTIDDFYKVYGYTCFYKADTGKANEVRAEEITISFVCSRYPQKLLRYLREEQHRTIEMQEDGIYYISDGLFAIQLIVTGQLSEENNLWLKSLTNDLESDRAAERLLCAYEKHRTEELYQSVMDIVIRANEERFMVSDMKEMCEALDELLDKRAAILAEERLPRLLEEKIAEHEKAAESRGMERGMKKGMERGMKKGMERGMEKGMEQGMEKGMQQGISQGIAQGEQQKILTQIQKKIRKGKSVAQIADELEETEETILPLYNRLKAEEGCC